MDWIDIQVEKIRKKIQNSSLLQAAVGYVLLYAGLAAVCSALTIRILRRWLILWAQGVLDLSPCQGEFLLFLSQWCAYVWLKFWMILMLRAFYKNRLKKPLSILKNGVTEIKSQNLEFVLDYPSEDEMGDLCRSFEELRQYLIVQYEEMWKKIEEQKQLNAAFAHDLRTPLTVLKGYSEFLARYLPKGCLWCDCAHRRCDTGFLYLYFPESRQEYLSHVRRCCVDLFHRVFVYGSEHGVYLLFPGDCEKQLCTVVMPA